MLFPKCIPWRIFKCLKYDASSIQNKKQNVPKPPDAYHVLPSDLLYFYSYNFLMFSFKINQATYLNRIWKN